MERKDAKVLLRKYLNGTCTEEERNSLEGWYRQHRIERLPFISDDNKERQLEDVWASLPAHREYTVRRWSFFRYAAAAVLIMALAGSVYYYLGGGIVNQTNTTDNDIVPGGNEATLTLADGRVVDLSSEQSGIIVDGGKVTYTDGKAILERGQFDNTEKPVMQHAVLTTPKGGQYQIILSDGTHVWLNAASTLKYPTRFDSRERVVTLEGEAYFSVAKDSSNPFRVYSGGQEIRVLGTEFNISAYTDDPEVKTTLVEGSVTVRQTRQGSGSEAANTRRYLSQNNTLVLKPGEQAILAFGEMTTKRVNVEAEIAWKQGLFQFQEENLASIMRKVSRWYNVEVVFEDPLLQSETFFGQVDRYSNISRLLNVLEGVGDARFEIRGRQVIITRKQEISKNKERS